jgi:hypothetical protein
MIPGTDIAVFHWVGPITLEDRQQNAKRCVEFCASRNVRRIIIDGRDQVSETDIMDSFGFAKDVPTEMAGLRMAVVYRPEDKALKFIETVAFNRGARTRSFVDFDAAKAWLASDA